MYYVHRVENTTGRVSVWWEVISNRTDELVAKFDNYDDAHQLMNLLTKIQALLTKRLT